MPKKTPKDQQFEFVENQEKDIADTTKRTYKQYLNKLAAEGFKTRSDLLNKAEQVVAAIKRLGDTQIKRNYFFASVFYITGRLDFERDPRGLPLFKAFQENYARPKN